MIISFILATVGVLLYSSYRALRGTKLELPALLPSSADDRPSVTMTGFNMVESEDGRMAWRVHAGRAELLDNKEARLEDVEALFREPDGRTAALIGESGTVDTENGNASIRRGTREVRIVTSDGYLLTTDELSWNARSRSVWTKDPFRVLGKDIYVEGTGMKANVDLEKLIVEDNVKAIVQE